MPTDAQMAQRRKELLAAEMAARREQAEATLTNLMTGETMPMPGLLPDPVETMRPQTAESLNRANFNTMLSAADRNRLFGVNRTDVPPSLIQGKKWQQQVLADQMRDAEGPGTDVDAIEASFDQDIPSSADAEIERQGLIPRTVPVYPGAKDAMVENPSGIARAMNFSVDRRQRNFNRNQQDWERYGGPEAGSLGGSGAVTRAPTTQRTARSEAVDVLSQINRKKNMLRAVSSIWGTKDNSQLYETTALAKYAGHLDRMAAQAVLAGGRPESEYQVIADFIRHHGSVKGGTELAEALFAGQTTAKPPSQRTIYSETHKIGEQWVPDASQPQGGYWVESWRTPIRDDDTNINLDVDLGKKGSIEFDKNFSSHLANLLMDPEQVYASIETESAQLPLLIDELSSGGLDVGAGQEGLLRIQQAMVRWLPPDLVSDLQRRNVGAQEWFKAVSDSFVGNKLKMTKGSISEREMKIFMDMIPSLSKSTEGNIRLLNMMHALNRIALSRKYGAEKFAGWVGTQEGGMAELRPTQKFLKLKEYQTDELKRSVRFLKYLQKQPVGRGYPPVPLDRVTAFMQLRNANTSEVTDQQINDQLDKWGYPSD